MKYKNVDMSIDEAYERIVADGQNSKYEDVECTACERDLLSRYAMYRISLRPPVLGGCGRPDPLPNPLIPIPTRNPRQPQRRVFTSHPPLPMRKAVMR